MPPHWPHSTCWPKAVETRAPNARSRDEIMSTTLDVNHHETREQLALHFIVILFFGLWLSATPVCRPVSFKVIDGRVFWFEICEAIPPVGLLISDVTGKAGSFGGEISHQSRIHIDLALPSALACEPISVGGRM